MSTDDRGAIVPRMSVQAGQWAGWLPRYDLSRALSWAARTATWVCGRFGTRATRQNLLSASPRFGLPPDEASGLIDRVAEIVRRYRRTVVFAPPDETRSRCGWRANQIGYAIVADPIEDVTPVEFSSDGVSGLCQRSTPAL